MEVAPTRGDGKRKRRRGVCGAQSMANARRICEGGTVKDGGNDSVNDRRGLETKVKAPVVKRRTVKERAQRNKEARAGRAQHTRCRREIDKLAKQEQQKLKRHEQHMNEVQRMTMRIHRRTGHAEESGGAVKRKRNEVDDVRERMNT